MYLIFYYSYQIFWFCLHNNYVGKLGRQLIIVVKIEGHIFF